MRASIAAAAAALAFAQPLATGWPAYRVDGAHSSYAPGLTPKASPPTGIVWTVSGADAPPDPVAPVETLSAVAVDATRDRAYWVAEQRLGEVAVLHAVTATTGVPAWNFTLTGFLDIYGAYALLNVLADGSVVAVTRSAVHRVRADGTAMWVTEQTQTVLDLNGVVAGDLVIVTAGLCGTGGARRAAAASTAAAAARGRASGGGTPPYSHAAFRLSDGGLAWAFVETMPGDGGFCSTPALGGPDIFFITTQEIESESFWWGVRFNATAAWTAFNGSLPDRGNPDIGSDWNAVVGGRFVAPYSDETGVEFRVAAVDVATGAATLYTDARGCWAQNGVCGSISGGPGGAGGRVYQIQPDDGAGYDALLLAFDARDLGDAGLLWSASIGPGPTNPLLNVPAVADGAGNVYAAFNRTLSAFGADGARLWTWTAPGEIVAQPAWPSPGGGGGGGGGGVGDMAFITYATRDAAGGGMPQLHIAALTWAAPAAGGGGGGGGGMT